MRIETGDVVEIDLDDESVTALVLLSTDEAVILDPLDGRMPVVMYPEALAGARVFDGSVA